jgi:hypothetical protein
MPKSAKLKLGLIIEVVEAAAPFNFMVLSCALENEMLELLDIIEKGDLSTKRSIFLT